jgi:hypothetical protein
MLSAVRADLDRMQAIAQVAADSGDLSRADRNRILSARGSIIAMGGPLLEIIGGLDPDVGYFAAQSLASLMIGARVIGSTAEQSGKARALLKAAMQGDQARLARAGQARKTMESHAAIEEAVRQECVGVTLINSDKFADAILEGVNRRLAEAGKHTSRATIRRVIAKMNRKSNANVGGQEP